jgi:hypothetical protein
MLAFNQWRASPMNATAITYAHAAACAIEQGAYQEAREFLRVALRYTSDRRAWSKLMLAAREVGRIVAQ